MQLYRIFIKLRFIILITGTLILRISESKAQYITDSSGLEGSGLAGQVLESAKEYKNRKVYSSLSPATIDSTPDNQLIQVVTDYLRLKMDPGLSNEYEVLNNEPEAWKFVYIVSQVEAEVNNGGFSQFFSSSAAKLGDQAEEAFKAIHAPLLAGLIRKAYNLYKLEGNTARFKDMDEEFYSLHDKENVSKLSVNYIRKNKKAFKAN